jgi:CRISPR-associated protein (TIGR03984 family)
MEQGGDSMNKLESQNGLTPLFLNKKTAKAHGELPEKNFKSFYYELAALCGETPKLAVFYFDFGIEFSLWDGKQFHFYEKADKLNENTFKYIQLARIFNRSEEIKVWCSAGKHYYRHRQDKKNDKENKWEFDAVEAQHVLWGTDFSEGGGRAISPPVTVDDKIFTIWQVLVEDRGTRIVVPLSENDAITKEKRLAIKTWNYVGELDNGLATYDDCRFLGLDISKESE